MTSTATAAKKNGSTPAAKKTGKVGKALTLNVVQFSLAPVQVSAKTGKAYTKNARYEEVGGTSFFGSAFFSKALVALPDGTLPQSITLTVTTGV